MVHACGSGGTAAGTALGAHRYGVAPVTHAVAVCDDRAYFETMVSRIIDECVALDPSLSRDPTRRQERDAVSRVDAALSKPSGDAIWRGSVMF